MNLKNQREQYRIFRPDQQSQPLKQRMKILGLGSRSAVTPSTKATIQEAAQMEAQALSQRAEGFKRVNLSDRGKAVIALSKNVRLIDETVRACRRTGFSSGARRVQSLEPFRIEEKKT